jgi:L-asparaginase
LRHTGVYRYSCNTAPNQLLAGRIISRHTGAVTICIIHTGGTIAMRQGPNGLAPAEGVLEAGLLDLQKTGLLRGQDVDIIPLAPLIDSANARFDDWNRMGAVIAAQHTRYRGFVVTHGTDTLAYTAAALSFSLLGLARPVIVTGAMAPFGAAGSDARRNLGDALLAAGGAAAGVWVQFAGHLMHGARAYKAHSHAADAFVGSPWLRPAHRAGHADATAPQFLPYGGADIAVLNMAPSQSGRALAAALDACEGAVLRVFGAGTIPDDPQLRAALMRAAARGALMVAVSQAPQGGVALGTYAAGAALAQAGVVDGAGMTTEAAYAKLAHALAHGGRAALARDLCGEM